ncbi:MAG TPA: endonuclease/exonuclease/phosphatase family protein [Polyangiaceae bacterium]|nr:endonuclease/exonuclease/phosphatase family protein [Polyangiaceae bacterium]
MMRKPSCLLSILLLSSFGLGACSSDNDPQCSAAPSCVSPEASTYDSQVDPTDSSYETSIEASPDTDTSEGGEAASGSDAPAESALPEASSPDGLRFMTFNIQHGANASLDAIAEAIRNENPDIVGLQEVDVDAQRSGHVDQPRVLSQRTGMAAAFQFSLTFSSGGYYGLAVLSRFPIVSTSKRLLSSTGEQRILMRVDVLTEHALLPVGVTHLGLTASERKTQVSEILEDLGSEGFAVLMGDMNAQPGDEEMKSLASAMNDAWLESSGQGFTFPVDTPTKRIDYIFLGNNWPSPTQAHVPTTKTSDHRPVVVFVPWN